MKSVAVDMIGKRFGRYTVLSRAERPPQEKQKQAWWLCKCDCGTIRNLKGNSLRSGNTQSCGCRQRDIASAIQFKHGLKQTPEYNSWCAAKQRCFYPKNKRYDLYGGRGVTMCDRWRTDFIAFLEDMGPRPQGYSLERIDPNGNYEPGNCKWATAKQQKENQRNSKFVFYEGRKWNLKRLSEYLGLDYHRLHRLHHVRNLPLEDTLNAY